MEEILEYSPILIKGTITTIELTLASAVLALIISFVVGLSRFSKLRSVRVAAIVYLEFFRGTSAELFVVLEILDQPLHVLRALDRGLNVLAVGIVQLIAESSL